MDSKEKIKKRIRKIKKAVLKDFNHYNDNVTKFDKKSSDYIMFKKYSLEIMHLTIYESLLK